MSESAIFRPKLFETFRGYSWRDFARDGIAGVTVGIVALSLSMALGIASEQTPAVGIYTAIVPGFIIAALLQPEFRLGGPSGAFLPLGFGGMATPRPPTPIVFALMAVLILRPSSFAP